jgi:small subunit ribosomal protein S4e
MGHVKRTEMPRTWPVPRKGRGLRFIAAANHSQKDGMPLLFVLREMLKIAPTRTEVRRVVLKGEVKVNGTTRKDIGFPIQVFDVVSFEKIRKNYKMEIVNGKFKLKEVSDAEAEKKIVKISGKKLVGKAKVQMNLEDGQNILIKENFSVGDSVVLNNKKKAVEKILPLKEGANIEIVSGKHAGEKGKLKSVEQFARDKKFVIKLKEGEVKLPLKTFMVIE